MRKKSIRIIVFIISVGLFSCQEESSSEVSTKSVETETPESSSDSDGQDHDSDQVSDQNNPDPKATLDDVDSNTRTIEKDGRMITVVLPPEEEVLRDIPEEAVHIPDVIDAYDFHSYEKLNTFLTKYVTYSGKVNYSSIKTNKSQLNDIIEEFEENYPESDWSYTQKLTYWINAYNVYTIKLVTDNYPTSSITKITAKPWHKKFIKLGGKTYSLNNIENDIVRKQFKEPRIHFALNCASKSCPVLLNKAYTPAKLYGQLTSQTKRFLSDYSKNDFSGKTIKISKIFDWYGEDFRKNGNTVIDFFNKYRSEQLSDPKISYLEYSWDLNK
tara:strand:- start:2548 stop:3531 length:984 start_codon:yes stop_codon:yes gene_type:complete